MADLHSTKTLAVKVCCACGAAILEHNRFCRRCGARQPEQFKVTGAHTSSMIESVSERQCTPSQYATCIFEKKAKPSSYRTVSGSLVRAVIAGMSARVPAQIEGRIARGAAMTLISITIWLIVILLSPLDAYGAVKTISDRA